MGLGLLFDRLMTNGVWWKDEAELAEALDGLADAGFDGKIGLSVDAYHGQAADRLLAFIRTAHEAFGRRDCVEITSVISADDGPLLQTFRTLASGLGGMLLMDGKEPAAIAGEGRTGRRERGKAATGAEPAADGEELRIDIIRFPYSASAEEGWSAGGDWFKDDYCAGPGNVFYVHPNGKVAVCCGFANENEDLVAGRIPSDGFATIMERAASSSRVRMRYETGLGEARKRLEAAGTTFPGRTEDICFFCDYLCKKSLPVALPFH
ncbi:MAG TPA: hypothetical protein DIC34_10755 [Treponema sp.]|nr:hypothetical protein [Treponema sp.]